MKRTVKCECGSHQTKYLSQTKIKELRIWVGSNHTEYIHQTKYNELWVCICCCKRFTQKTMLIPQAPNYISKLLKKFKYVDRDLLQEHIDPLLKAFRNIVNRPKRTPRKDGPNHEA